VTKFRHLPVAGRLIIITVAIGVFAIAVVACATSYNAIYRLVGQLGLYGYRINQGFPLLLDAAFLVAELAAILAGIMRAVTRSDQVSAGWPGAAMLLCGLGTIGFNVRHAYLLGGRGDPLTVWRCVVSALPPVLMMISFQVLIAIVKWVMLHLGRPLNSAAALSPTPGMLAGPIYHPDGQDWNVLHPGLPGDWPPGASGPVPAGHHLPENRQNRQSGLPVGNGADPAGVTKRQRIEEYLDWLGPEELQHLTVRELTADLQENGLKVTERYVKQILDHQRPTPARQPQRRRGSGPHKPRR
jgi:hypothetical protein